jgi:hypothetical protein
MDAVKASRQTKEALKIARRASDKEHWRSGGTEFDQTVAHEGVVVQMCRGKFGFVMCEGKKIFFHLSDVIPPTSGPKIEMQLNCKVVFRATEDQWSKGKLKAHDVCVVAPAPNRQQSGSHGRGGGDSFRLQGGDERPPQDCSQRGQRNNQQRWKQQHNQQHNQQRQQEEDWRSFLSSRSRNPSTSSGSRSGWRMGNHEHRADSPVTNALVAKGPANPGAIGFGLRRSVECHLGRVIEQPKDHPKPQGTPWC